MYDKTHYNKKKKFKTKEKNLNYKLILLYIRILGKLLKFKIRIPFTAIILLVRLYLIKKSLSLCLYKCVCLNMNGYSLQFELNC